MTDADGSGNGVGGGEGPAEEGMDDATHVVTAFLRNRGEILLLRRGDAVGTYSGRWGGVSGYAEGDTDAQVRVEIAEDPGLAVAVSLVRSGRPVRFEDPGLEPEREWVVHPSLFDCEDREVTLSAEHDALECSADGDPGTRVPDGVDGADTEGDGVPDAQTVLKAALVGIDRTLEADRIAAERAREYADGTVLTLSRSDTVLAALRTAELARVFVAESRPACEGVGVAEELAADSDGEILVTLHTDAAAAHVLASEGVDRVLVGADAVLPDGRVVNKAGTRGVAVAAACEDVPVYAVAAADKVSTRETVNLESGDREAVYDGDARIDIAIPTFDVTPADCVTGVVTERDVLESADVRDVAAELRALEDWRDV